jgi:hypothetical protein
MFVWRERRREEKEKEREEGIWRREVRRGDDL